jgi:hypothetical protein
MKPNPPNDIIGKLKLALEQQKEQQRIIAHLKEVLAQNKIQFAQGLVRLEAAHGQIKGLLTMFAELSSANSATEAEAFNTDMLLDGTIRHLNEAFDEMRELVSGL